jgi:hypothetical protein
MERATTRARAPDYPCQPLEDQITELWGHINAATYRFLKLVAEFDVVEGWGWHGCADCAQWLNWQCGIGNVAAREKVRVARALEKLPKISASFESGEISYSKVRAMTRVATPENEHVLMNIALQGTAAHVERIVRQYRRVKRLEGAWLANEVHRHRYLRYCYDDDGALLIEARLPTEVGAMLKQAIEAAEEVLYQAEREAMDDDSAETSDESMMGIVTAAGSPYSAEEENTLCVRRADALWLLAERFLNSEAGSASSSDRFLVTVHIDRSELTDNCDAAESSLIAGRPARSGLEDGPTLAAETIRRLGCDGSLVGIVEDAFGNPLNIGRKTRAIPPSIKRALTARDGGCRFPSCNRTRFTDGHHIQHWADGGETKLTNLITLCRFHHRLLHEGGFGLRVTNDGLFVFSRPDGSRIEDSGCFSGSSMNERQRKIHLTALNDDEGVEIDPRTIRPYWTGETMDSSLVIDALLHVRDQL